jgi:putative peptide zinc metalloprotease protein
LRQWPELLSAFSDSMKVQGLAIYAAVLLVLKAIHEFGHGLTTARHGCQVPSMGIAFMLGTPVLYTDTSDSWRLARRTERLAIVFAGVGAEMIVATAALLLWSLLPDGMSRQICFTIVTSALVSTVVINLNPFMRYDGYFALSDALRVPNLQSRAFDLALWRMREFLFDLRRQPPEQLPQRLQTTLVIYAALTAFYRVGLYIGIAAIVYHIGSKLLGLLLGLFEIVFFILLPVSRELKQWWSDRSDILARRRIRWSMCLPVVALLTLCLPWLTVAEVPAVLQARVDEPIHLPIPAVIVETHVKDGQLVTAGQLLFVATSPDFEHQLAKSRAEAAAYGARLTRLHASDKERSERLTIESRYRKAQEKSEAIERLMAGLTIRAPIDGRVVDVDPELSLGAWQSIKRPLTRVVSIAGVRARGVLSDADIHRVVTGAAAQFVPDDVSLPVRSMRLVDIARASNGRLAEPALVEKFGGIVPANDEKGELLLRHGWADVQFDAETPPPTQTVRGIMRVDATAISPMRLILSQIARVLVREHGF